MPCLVDSLGKPVFFRREMEEKWVWGLQSKGGAGRGGRRGCCQDVIYERMDKKSIAVSEFPP